MPRIWTSPEQNPLGLNIFRIRAAGAPEASVRCAKAICSVGCLAYPLPGLITKIQELRADSSVERSDDGHVMVLLDPDRSIDDVCQLSEYATGLVVQSPQRIGPFSLRVDR